MENRVTDESARPAGTAARIRGRRFPGHAAFPLTVAFWCLVLAVAGVAGVRGPAGVDSHAGATHAVRLTAAEQMAPAITSADSALSQVGGAFSFMVTSTGDPDPTLSYTGALPTGLTFTDNGNGTATIAGTPAAGTGGNYPIVITAANGVGTNATQTFTLDNAQAPTITSPATVEFATGVAGAYEVTTTGTSGAATDEYPTLTTGTLPTGLSFVDNGNGTGTLSAATSLAAGTYTVDITATVSDISASVTLPLTVDVVTGVAPDITSSDIADFTQNQAGSITIVATGTPTPTISYEFSSSDDPVCTALQAGLTQSGGTGSLTISGTPTATGTCTLLVTASNGVGTAATQTLPIIVGAPPAFTSADTATGAVGSPFSFTVTTSGYPYPDFGWSNVPPGLTFAPGTTGTATISGTPTVGGVWPMDLSACNSYVDCDPTSPITQTLTITVPLAPAITSADTATFGTGETGSFTFTANGAPCPTFTETGALPAGVTLGNSTCVPTAGTVTSYGEATLSGIPGPGTTGTYPITITATNGSASTDTVTQNFVLTVTTVDTEPAITSADSTSFTAGSAGTFAVTSTGIPTASLTETGTLPAGVTFTADDTTGTATIAGTSTDVGSFPITISASNGFGTAATQTFTLTISPVAPAITSAASATFAGGQANSFTVATTGYPAPALTETGTLPNGVSFKDNGNGTGTLAGTPTSVGSFPITITAENSGGTTPQSFVLTVTGRAPAFRTGSRFTETARTAFSFVVDTVGTPSAKLSAKKLPAGMKLVNYGGGAGELSGSSKVRAGTYHVTVTASNAVGSHSQVITLSVKAAGKNKKERVPGFTSKGSATGKAGKAFSFKVKTAGSPTKYRSNIAETGTLPAGVAFKNNRNGTATLSGTPKATSAGVYTFTLTAKDADGSTTQAFVLTIDGPPTVTTAGHATVSAGQAFTITIKATGAPAPVLAEQGPLPHGVKIAYGDDTATLTGKAAKGMYVFRFTARNAFGRVSRSFTLTVK